MSLLALFATVTLIACASARKFCCLPERYSAETLVKVYREGHFFQGTGEVYFDNTAGIHASFVNLTIDESKGIYSLTRIHLDVNSRNIYIMTGGECTKAKINDAWLKETDQTDCIPDSAILDSSLVLGGPHEDVEMNRYIQAIKGGQRQLIITQHHCYPVQEIYFTGDKTKHGFQVKDSTMNTVANLRLSVEDPSVFVLPDICKKIPLSTKRNNDNDLPVNPWQFVPFLASV